MADQIVALLRGINVGGNHKMVMADLRAWFEAVGCRDVRTLALNVLEGPVTARNWRTVTKLLELVDQSSATTSPT